MISAFRTGDYLVVRIRCTSTSNTEHRRPLHIGFVIDTSGSMEGERLAAVKRTLHAARSLWTPTDKCTLIGFNDIATVYHAGCTMDETGISTFYEAVDSMTASGCTDLSVGLSSLYSCSPIYDCVILLTDGVVNRGVRSVEGLQALACRQVVHTLGYGADHSRTLLRRLATTSRASYTYVDSDEILPIAIGSIVADARGEQMKNVSVLPPPGFQCIEPTAPVLSPHHYMGNILVERDYWCVFRGAGDGPVQCIVGDQVVETAEPLISDADELQEQILRARVATVLEKTTNAIEDRRPVPYADISALLTEIAALPTPLRMRPLILTFVAQLTEANSTVATTPHAAARMAAVTTILSTQRGVYNTATDEDPATLYTFCSPVQRATSQTVHGAYV
jgi:hypothetical protein